MPQDEQAPLVSEDVEIGDFSDEFEEPTGTPQPARSRTMLRTTLAVLMFAGLATFVVMGPVDNPLHASPKFTQKWSFDEFWDGAAEKLNEAKTHVTAGINEAKTHIESSGIVDTVQEHASNAYAWGTSTAQEYWSHAENYFDQHISPETIEHVKGQIEELKSLPGWAKEKGEQIFCELKGHLGDVKARLREKILTDFKDITSACGQDFRSVACGDDMVADACQHVGAMDTGGVSVEGLDLNVVLNAPKNFCEVTFQEIVKDIQDDFAGKADMIKGQMDLAQDAAQSATLLRTSLDLEMGTVDAEVNNICSSR